MADLRESALNFGSSPPGGLVGILTMPSEPRDGSDTAVVILNAGVLHRVGPNRIHVRMARSLASRGIPCLRIDLPGIGDSRGLDGANSLLEESILGARAAFDLLARHDVASRFLVFGLCSGADHAFSVACADPRVAGIALADPNRIFTTRKAQLLRVLRWSTRPEVWFRLIRGQYGVLRKLRAALRDRGGQRGETAGVREDTVRKHLSGLVDRGVRICYLITGAVREYVYERQLYDAFPEIPLAETATVHLFPESGHTFPREMDRRRLESVVTEWAVAIVEGDGTTEASAPPEVATRGETSVTEVREVG